MIDLVGAGKYFHSKTVDRTRRFEMSPALAVLYLGVRRDLKAEDHPRTNYLINPGYDCVSARLTRPSPAASFPSSRSRRRRLRRSRTRPTRRVARTGSRTSRLCLSCRPIQRRGA